MNTKIHMLLLFVFTLLQSCKAQQSQTQTTLPKIENYTKGELEIKVIPFGFDNPITVGEITADGTIHFNWNNDISSVKDPQLYMSSIKNAVGMSFCTTKEVEQNNKEAKSVEAEQLFLYKYGQQVGSLFPATQKEIQDNNGINRSSSLVLGSTLSWFYSDNDVVFNAKCTVKNNRKNMYDFDEVTDYDIHFKKGWNMVLNTLVEKEDWKNETQKGSLPKTLTKATITKIPNTINWHLKYWANDALLEIEQKLMKLKPIPKEQYESWLPKKLSNLKRTSFEIGKTIKRMPTLNNVNLVFEKASKKIEVTIADCVGNKGAVGMYTLMQDMASRDWKDKKETGYESASSIDGVRVITIYNEKESKTQLSYAANERFLVKAEAINISPEELWETLKDLQIEKLIKK